MRAAGDIEQYMANRASSDAERASWSSGGTNSTLLHALVGAAASALGNGNALQGGLGAGASEAAAGAMQDYLVNHGIDPNGANGRSLMQLASAAIGGSVGGGSGAASALNGQLYNEQLHPDLLKGLMARVNDFAKATGLSPEEAQNRLLVEAMRLQDSGYNAGLGTDQIGGGKGVPDDAQARAFLQQNNLYAVSGQTVDIFKPAAPDDSKQNAYALYDYLYQNPDAAKAYYGAQESALSQRGISSNDAQQNQNLARWANQDVLANYYASDVTKQSDNDFYKFYGQIALAGASGGLSAGAPFLAAANAAREGGTGSTVLAYMLATRAGAGVTSGAVNAVSQVMQDGTVRWTNVGVATAGGALGVGGGLRWNAAVGGAGGFVQTELNNWIYNENKNVFLEAAASGVTGGFGYRVGDKTTGALSDQWPRSLIPIISGNVAGSIASEGANAGIDRLGEKKEDKSTVK